MVVLVLAALAGAGCCAGAAGIAWWTRTWADPLSGTVHTAARGSDLLPELVPVALVALAGLGATFATRGAARRAVGVLVAVGGLLVVVRAGMAVSTEPVSALKSALTRPATGVGPAARHLVGPVLAIAGGILVMLAGVLVASGSDRARRMGSAYDAPGRRREQILQRARDQRADSAAAAPDPGDLWRAMDAGADLTEPAARPPDPAGTAAPGREDPLGPDTISPPDGPDAADGAHRDPHGRRSQRHGPTPPGAG